MEEEIWQVFRFLPKRFLLGLIWLRWGQAKLVFTRILPILTLLLANGYAIFIAKFNRVQFTGFGKAQYRFRHQAQIFGKRTLTPAKFPKFWTFYFKEKKLGLSSTELSFTLEMRAEIRGYSAPTYPVLTYRLGPRDPACYLVVSKSAAEPSVSVNLQAYFQCPLRRRQ